MTEWFVFYHDDYPDNGGIGMKRFATAKEAARYIECRIAEDPISRTMDKYTVIEGKEHETMAVKYATKVGIV